MATNDSSRGAGILRMTMTCRSKMKDAPRFLLFFFLMFGSHPFDAPAEIDQEPFLKCLREKNRVCAENALLVISALHPEDSLVIHLSGVLKFYEGKQEEAKALFEEAVRRDPNRNDSRMLLSLLYMKAGAEPSSILQQWKWVAQNDPALFRRYGSIFGIKEGGTGEETGANGEGDGGAWMPNTVK